MLKITNVQDGFFSSGFKDTCCQKEDSFVVFNG